MSASEELRAAMHARDLDKIRAVLSRMPNVDLATFFTHQSSEADWHKELAVAAQFACARCQCGQLATNDAGACRKHAGALAEFEACKDRVSAESATKLKMLAGIASESGRCHAYGCTLPTDTDSYTGGHFVFCDTHNNFSYLPSLAKPRGTAEWRGDPSLLNQWERGG